jgi:hypothetical protein
MSGHPGGVAREVADVVQGYQSSLSQQPAPQQQADSINPLGLYQSYKANPFSLQTDMSRPAQFLPPELSNFDYGAQWRAQNVPKARTPGMTGQSGGWEGPGNSASDGVDAAGLGNADAMGADAMGGFGGMGGLGGLGLGMGLGSGTDAGGGDGGGGGK